MSVLTGRSSSVDKSLGYVAEIGHIDSGSLLQFLSLLEYSMADMVPVMIFAQVRVL
jgi:hypothetical protein